MQAVYFDEILGEANRRLAGMTNNRYRLVRHEDAERLNDRGLELGVIDGHTGKERHVSTLSGGEGFIASPWHWRWAYPTWCSAAAAEWWWKPCSWTRASAAWMRRAWTPP